jgi:hypothetical protein
VGELIKFASQAGLKEQQDDTDGGHEGDRRVWAAALRGVRPRSTPATSSPSTAGCPRRSASSPPTLAPAMIAIRNSNMCPISICGRHTSPGLLPPVIGWNCRHPAVREQVRRLELPHRIAWDHSGRAQARESPEMALTATRMRQDGRRQSGRDESLEVPAEPPRIHPPGPDGSAGGTGTPEDLPRGAGEPPAAVGWHRLANDRV